MAWDLDYNAIERGVRAVLDELGNSKLKDAKVFLACFSDFEPERREEAEAFRACGLRCPKKLPHKM